MAYTIGEIADALGAEAAGDLSLIVHSVAEPQSAGMKQLALAMEPSYSDSLRSGAADAAIVWSDADWQDLGLKAAIFAPRSRYVLAGVSRVFEHRLDVPEGIHPSAVVDETAEIGKGTAIGPFVHVAAGARIGANAVIVGHVSIGRDVVIGRDAILHPHVRIADRVRIGDRFICQAGAVIGGDGFSFVTPKPGAVEEARATGRITEASRTDGFVRINSLGSVVIGNDVEIGALSTIDRGTVADTGIGDGTKLDNHVTIGHNVQIGKTCLFCGNSGSAGSSVIGDRVVVGGKAAIADHITVGSDVVLAGMAGVSSNVPPGRIMMGNPAMRMDLMVESYKALRRLPRILKRLEPGKNKVSNDPPNE